MRKYALIGLIATLSFWSVGCIYSGGSWSKGIRYGDKREATVCGKETVQVPTPDNPNVTEPEYRIQLTWDDVERGARPMLWSVVGEKTYQTLNISDKVIIWPHDLGQLKGHATVIYYWTHDQISEIGELKYEFDLPEDPHPR